MFWAEETQRRVSALALRDTSVPARYKRTLTVEEAAKDMAQLDIEWAAEYERRADARSAAWRASIFCPAVHRLFGLR